MFINLTEEDKKQIEAVESQYDSQIQKIQTKIEELLPDFEKKTSKKHDVSLEVLEIFETGDISFYKKKYNQEIVTLLNDTIELSVYNLSDTINNLCSEQIRITVDKSKSIETLLKDFEKREFNNLCEGKTEKIILSAKEQIKLLINNCVSLFTKMIETGRNDSGEPISAFCSSELRVSNDGVWIDATEFYQFCQNDLLFLHYDVFRNSNDQINLQKLNDLVLNTITQNSWISSEKGVLGEPFFIKKQKKPRSKKIIPNFSAEDFQDFFPFSTTNAKNALFDLLSNDGDVTKTALAINTVARKNTAKKHIGEKSRAIQVETANAQTIIEILGSDRKIKSRPAKKILHFIESEIYQHTYYNGQMTDEIVVFPLKKMVDKGLYKSVNNARRAFNDASDVLTALRVSATLKSRKSNKDVTLNEGNARVVLFPTMSISNGQCFVRLNQDINWTPILKDYFLMPDSWWALPDNASDLEYKIFRAARLNTRKLNKNALTFNVSLKSVAAWLNLPLKTKNPKRNVKQPIETAIDQINQSLDPNTFRIKIKTDLNASIEQYLKGYLEVTMSGVYTDNLIDINKKQREMIEKNIRKKEEIVKEASIRKLAETMKSDEEKS